MKLKHPAGRSKRFQRVALCVQLSAMSSAKWQALQWEGNEIGAPSRSRTCDQRLRKPIRYVDVILLKLVLLVTN